MQQPATKTEFNRPHPSQLLRLAQGFSKLLWGIPFVLLLTFGFFSVGPFPGFKLPSYVLGSLVVYWGVILLHQAGAVTRSWQWLVKLCAVTVFLQFYLSPFVYWWRQSPNVNYYAAHVFALILVMTVSLLLINQLAGELAKVSKNTTFFIESRLCAGLVVGLMIIPMLFGLLYAIQACIRHSTSLYIEFTQIHYDIPGWVQGFFLLPFTLTMAIAWKAKEQCFRLLTGEMKEELESNLANEEPAA